MSKIILIAHCDVGFTTAVASLFAQIEKEQERGIIIVDAGDITEKTIVINDQIKEKMNHYLSSLPLHINQCYYDLPIIDDNYVENEQFRQRKQQMLKPAQITKPILFNNTLRYRNNIQRRHVSTNRGK